MCAAPTPRGEATRLRMLDAASVEFAERGLAGARVDRIAEAARSNKAQLYGYFGNKEQLFDAVFAEHVDRIVDAVPLDASDLPGYAVALHDSYLSHPEVVRLATWNRLERHPSGDLFHDGIDHDLHKVVLIQQAQEAGQVDHTLHARDILATVTALSMTWSPASAIEAVTADDDGALHARHRDALRRLVERMFAVVPSR